MKALLKSLKGNRTSAEYVYFFFFYKKFCLKKIAFSKRSSEYEIFIASIISWEIINKRDS